MIQSDPSLRRIVHSEDFLSRRVHWLGAISFEDRAIGSLSRIQQSRTIELTGVTLVDYPAIEDEGIESARSATREAMLEIATSKQIDSECLGVHPYRMGGLLSILRAIEEACVDEDDDVGVAVDITCLTKIHKIAVAKWIADRSEPRNVLLCYSKPAGT